MKLYLNKNRFINHNTFANFGRNQNKESLKIKDLRNQAKFRKQLKMVLPNAESILIINPVFSDIYQVN
jgi:hypothetical protein